MSYRLKLNEERRTFLSRLIYRQIDQALRDRSTLESEWRENDDMYSGRYLTTTSDAPWPGSSSFCVPLMPTYVNAVTGRLVDSMHAPEPTFTARNVRRSPDWKEAAEVVQDWLEYRVREVLRLRTVSEKAVFTLVKHGTTFIYVPYQVLLNKRLRYNIERDSVEQSIDVHKAGPTAIVPFIDDVLLPKEAVSIDTAPWFALRWRLTYDDLMTRKFSNVYDDAAVTEALGKPDGQVDVATRARWATQGFAQGSPDDIYTIWEWWGLARLPGHDFATELIVPFHLSSSTPLSALVNYYPHQFRPLFAANFQQTDQGPYGFGVGRMTRSGNDEVNKLHKHRVDNAMVANTRAFKIRTGSYQQLPRKFRIWPGKFIPVQDMADLEAMQIADVYGSTMNEEMLTRRTMEQYVGLADFSLHGGGGDSLKRVGATPALIAVQESGRVLNYRMNHIRTMYAELASWLLEMDCHFRPVGEMLQVLGPRGFAVMQRLLDSPPDAIRGHMLIELTASSAQVNREIDKQSDMLLVNIMRQYVEGYWQMAQTVVMPGLPSELKKVGISSLEMMNSLIRDVLRDFNKRNDALILSGVVDGNEAGASVAPPEPAMGGGNVGNPFGAPGPSRVPAQLPAGRVPAGGG